MTSKGTMAYCGVARSESSGNSDSVATVSAEKLIEIVRSLAASLDQIGMTMTIPMYLAKLDFETQVSVALATFLHHLKEELNHSVPLVPQSSTH